MAEPNVVKERTWGTVLGAVICVSTLLIATLLWLFWPYPTVTSEGVGVMTNTPAIGYFQTGDVMRWTTPEVCQPSGRTEVTIHAVLDFKEPGGDGVATSETLVVSRTFDVNGFPECVTNNPTSAYVDGDLPTGTYRILIEACVQNRSPRPVCETFAGPTNVKIVRVARNEPAKPVG